MTSDQWAKALEVVEKARTVIPLHVMRGRKAVANLMAAVAAFDAVRPEVCGKLGELAGSDDYWQYPCTRSKGHDGLCRADPP